ncbi:response regulator [Paludisphaera mucosa]|uniref:histidine kinase n=1 Tax=Paludisphaera mucosa TaxID=3030827 RepID=A0ABT6FBR7_9BACT|nr:response regulator [Paludisphaera mucosa]MDG3005040.1 response regulator [Paludisphaera mucosa]
MTDQQSTAAGRGTGMGLFLGVAAVLAVFVVSGLIAYLNTRTLYRNARLVMHTHRTITTLADVFSLMKDAETGQRGYVLTGDVRYLEPYQAALAQIDRRVNDLSTLLADSADQLARIPAMRGYIDAKRRELGETVDLRRTRGFEAAQAVVLNDSGKAAMDALRALVAEMQGEEEAERGRRLAEMDFAYQVAVGSGVLTGVLGALLSLTVGYLLRRSMLIRRRQDWFRAGQLGLSAAIVGEQRLAQLGQSVLKFLSGYLDAHAGAFFVESGADYRRVATLGVPSPGDTPERFGAGEGLLGQAAVDARTTVVRDVPDGYLAFGSALGKGKPRHLVIAPLVADEAVKGVLELGFVHPLDDRAIQILEMVSGTVGVAVKSANYRLHLQNLLEETQRQSEELQTQSEELRVSNEELEEQGRALKESQTRLELQQAELEQTNAQLEEQASMLEAQRDELVSAKDSLLRQARDLEQASQYKSDFLANMSHELRTPLNSSLILARLLADNPEGNLSDEQVRYAETIQAAGNDLLVLINDILDLSKIEAGHMEIRPETVSLARLMDGLRRTFEPVAAQKGLAFQAKLAPGCPEVVVTDRQRFEQVLRNLLSNAMKFTPRGEVTIAVGRAADGRIAFAVTDTGIGIAREQHGVVFEAFRQADGTTNRRFGGTGLGLSISRELARLLGGEIRLESEPGRGSTFTVTIPETYDAALARARGPILDQPPPPAPSRAATPAPLSPGTRPAAPTWTRQVEDDRERLTSDRRVILVVEDDPSFARVLYDLTRELDFQCLIASSAEEAVAVAVQFLPSAVLLDIGLPDHSGLSVLDRLKHDARTRHIPVHVVSAGDHARTALELGAVGYMLKPVKREELADALRLIETRLAQRLRRVLVVEDDPVQLDSLRRLLALHDVETTGIGTAAECLERLRETTFDCMVLDLSLPDASGYSLLETLSREDAYAFPPVIVYTGRELSDAEEQRLRRYSKSIIIKGAKSPERLLDEVTLFLHQVVSDLPAEQQRMLEKAMVRDSALEGRRILVVEDDVRNVFAITSILEPRGAVVQIARNGLEALAALEKSAADPERKIDLVLMDVMMPEMDGLAATREIRKRPEWKKLPVIMLTAKAMKDDQANCLEAGANDYMAKPLDVEKILSLVRVWMPR